MNDVEIFISLFLSLLVVLGLRQMRRSARVAQQEQAVVDEEMAPVNRLTDLIVEKLDSFAQSQPGKGPYVANGGTTQITVNGETVTIRNGSDMGCFSKKDTFHFITIVLGYKDIKIGEENQKRISDALYRWQDRLLAEIAAKDKAESDALIMTVLEKAA